MKILFVQKQVRGVLVSEVNGYEGVKNPCVMETFPNNWDKLILGSVSIRSYTADVDAPLGQSL